MQALRLTIAAVLLAACPAAFGGGQDAAAAKAPKTPAFVANADSDDPPARLTVSGDFNHDGDPDVAEVAPQAGSDPARLLISLGQPNGSYRQQGPGLPLDARPRALLAGDFDRDGNTDLVVGDDDGTVLLFRGDGRGGFDRTGAVAHLGSVVSMVAADFNADGTQDLAISDWRSSKVYVLAGDGQGGFRNEGEFPLRMAGTSPHLSAADFNGDGIPDLAVVYDSDDGPSYDVLLGDGHGGFTLSPKLSLIRDPNSHCVT